jgi:hypothetical protein
MWAVCTGTGTALSVAGWWSASGQGAIADQIPPASVCLLGALVAFAGQVAWVLRGRRAVGARAQWLLPEAPAEDPAVVTATLDAGDGRLVAGDGLVHYHRVGCRFALGRDWPAAGRTEHEASGRRPCGACRPGPAVEAGR